MDGKICVVYLLLFLNVQVLCYLIDIEATSKNLDKLLADVELSRNTINSESNIEIWQEYEFGTGVGNREELIITNITTTIDPEFSYLIENYQFMERNGEYFLAGSSDHVFSLYKLDLNVGNAVYRTDVNSVEKILTFKLLSLPNTSSDTLLFAILCVESSRGTTDLLWYRFTGEQLVKIWSWPVQDRVERLQFFHHEKQNRLILLREEISYLGQVFSPIDIYGFSIESDLPELWISQRLTLPKTVDIQICPTFESNMITLQRQNDFVIYEYKGDKNKEGLFLEHEIVTSNGLRNLICFESGHIRYLVTSGPEAVLYNFFENEFQHDSDTEHVFYDIGEISWITSLPVDTYREESILLVQLKNSTIISLSWKGQGFERTPQSELDFGQMDLSKVTVIPNFGFISGNQLVKIQTTLREKPRPVIDEMEKLLQTRKSLAEVLRKQELIFDETETRIKNSYLVNPVVTGFWNLSSLEVESLVIDGETNFDNIFIGSKRAKLEELFYDFEETNNVLADVQSKLEEIKTNLANAIPANSPEVILNDDLIIDGEFNVQGPLMSVVNLTFDYLNGFSREEISNDLYNNDPNVIIEGEKMFDSIDAENLNVLLVNGVPITNIIFDAKPQNYSNIDFSKLNKLEINGNLNLSSINGESWENLMRNIVMKSGDSTIPGVTIIEGDLLAEKINVDLLNGLNYPDSYIMTKSKSSVVLSGINKFGKLTIGKLDLREIQTLNGLSIDEYVTLNSDTTLTQEITFEDLTVTESLQIEGNITGLPEIKTGAGPSLKEVLTVTSDVVFANLLIVGDLQVQDSIDETEWSKFDDLISKDDEVVEITGRKTFLEQVQVESPFNIWLEKINSRLIQEFLTLDTEQELPNLKKISGNVAFDKVTRGDVANLVNVISQNADSSDETSCLNKPVIFRVAPIVDRLFLNKINGYISAHDFSVALNRTFSNVRFQNLETLNLRAGDISPRTINGKDIEELERLRISKTQPQTLSGDYEIDLLETETLTARTIDGISTEKFKLLINELNGLYDGLLNGSVAVDTLTVEGNVNVLKINQVSIDQIYHPDQMGTIVFARDVYIENLVVDGLVNGINFTDYLADAVLKTDTNIILTGRKILGKMHCEILDVSKLNGKPVSQIFDPEKHQVISGSIKVNGSVKILQDFSARGKFGGVSWEKIKSRFNYLGNNTYSLIGNVDFTKENVSIDNLMISDSIQGTRIGHLLKSLVRKTANNITIYTPVIFTDPVTIESPLTITERFNDLDLKYFYDHAVRIDRSFSVKSKVLFNDDIAVDENLNVEKKLKARTISGVDLTDLYERAAYDDRPTFISEPVTFENVIFESDIQVEIINDMEMSEVITLHGEQSFFGTLRCADISVDTLETGGTFNGHNLEDIFKNTFMLTGHQSMSGNLRILGKVDFQSDFDARLINGIDPSAMIPIDGEEALIGNFVFEKPLILHGNLNSRGLINGIDLMKWRATAVTKIFPVRQVVKGDWIIHGNVEFKGNIDGSNLLDGVEVTELVNDLHRRDRESQLLITDVERNLHSICEDMSVLKKSAENQIYKYKFFEYLQVLDFDRSIVSVHQFASGDFDYLLVNFDTCHLEIFSFTGTEFVPVKVVSSFGYIERWFTFYFEGQIYFLTVGSQQQHQQACGKSDKGLGNLWKFADNQFIHILDLGNVTEARKIGDEEFLIVVDGDVIHHSILKIYQRSVSCPISYTIGSDNVKFIENSRRVLLIDRHSIYEYQSRGISNVSENCFGTNDIASFQVGIYKQEIFIYYDENLSDDYLFISENNLQHRKILQTIKVQHPSSFIILNFDEFVENFFMYVENKRSVKIYEYKGVEGFVYRETIKIAAERILKFELRMYPKFVKKHCIAAIQGKRLVILQAKMYGEKLDIGSLSCEK